MAELQWIPLAFGMGMAIIDVFMLGLIKSISQNTLKYIRWMIVPTVLYAIQPWIFLSSMQFESLTVMNLMWDLISDVLVTLTGFFYFKEKIGPYKTLGVLLSFIAIILMSIKDGEWSDYINF
jgi:drug/metabolite transporter (DMT)-like permease